MPDAMNETRSPPARAWADVRWSELPPGAAERWIAVLPLAATEQHGPHLPLETDTLIAEAYLARTMELLPASLPVTFLPVEEVGLSIEHTDFAGTRTLTTEGALAAWMGIGADIAGRGLRKLVMVTSHGGNTAAMMLVAQELRARFGLLAVTTNWHRFGQPPGMFSDSEIRHGIHGGAIETSIMLAAFPDQVQKSLIANFEPASLGFVANYRYLSTQRPAPFAWQAQDLHPSGAVGDATQASAEKGRRLIDHGAAAFCELLADVDRFDLAALRPGPARRGA
ncbi:creatininase family protein [Bradyrhizobium sp. WD16]|uniref:creatininase family protein n=1 Tax=Bradyrhizobium sp. WD16 TaxID=1521768 RepID=UPI0020A426F1|nr:creatininase family protein [Bradyrhizobium sp. WD16]